MAGVKCSSSKEQESCLAFEGLTLLTLLQKIRALALEIALPWKMKSFRTHLER